MGSSKYDERLFPQGAQELRRAQEALAKVERQLLEQRTREASNLAAILDALEWQGGTMDSIAEGIRALRRALALWACTDCNGTGRRRDPQSWKEEGCLTCGGRGLNPIAVEALASRET